LENAFAATLEELKYASLILHVRDMQMPFENRYSEAILAVLKKIGVTAPIIDVWNKCDLLEEPPLDGISAKNGTGIKELQQKIVTFLTKPTETKSREADVSYLGGNTTEVL
jgi:GTP-binding protein HflX